MDIAQGLGIKNDLKNRTLFMHVLLTFLVSFVRSYDINYDLVLVFPTGRDSATFRDKGTEVSSLSRDKGTTGQAKNLPRDGTGMYSQNSGRVSQNPGRDAGQNGTEQKRIF